ncbi:MAG: NAD-dependent epimerase, partial [Gammaproteobacteria bacterium]|nr:NAD-dependent epimerase [Gammaproteobacteria bacterium]
NIARGEETSLNELAATLLAVMGSALRPEHGPLRTVNPVPRRLADIGKAQRLLGFRASIGLAEGLERLVCWWTAQRRAA